MDERTHANSGKAPDGTQPDTDLHRGIPVPQDWAPTVSMALGMHHEFAVDGITRGSNARE